MLQLPTLGLAAAYSPTGDAAEGAASSEYNAVIGLYLIVWGFALFTFWIFTLKTNMIFAGIFLLVTTASWVLAGAYFKVASGDYETAGQLQKVRLSCIVRLFGVVIADICAGWRGVTIRGGSARMVYVFCDHVRGNAIRHQLPCRRFEPFLA